MSPYNFKGKGIAFDQLVKIINNIRDLLINELNQEKAGEIINCLKTKWKQKITKDNCVDTHYGFKLDGTMYFTKDGVEAFSATLKETLEYYQSEYNIDQQLVLSINSLVSTLPEYVTLQVNG